MTSNNFDKDKLKTIFGEYPEKYLHFIGITGEGLPDAFHHILKRNKENNTLSSIFNALSVNNAKHLQYHGRLLIKENQVLFLNLVVSVIYKNWKNLKQNSIMFRPDLFFDNTDRLFIQKYIKAYTKTSLKKLEEMDLC